MMLGRTYDDQVCSIARSLEVLGERWTLLIVRDALLGLRRFDDFQRSLGVARNVLTERLGRLTATGVLERVAYSDHPPRYEYHLTPMGGQLAVPLIALMHWGDEHFADAQGPPRLTRHRDCGGEVQVTFACDACDRPVGPAELEILPRGAPRKSTSDRRRASTARGVTSR